MRENEYDFESSSTISLDRDENNDTNISSYSASFSSSTSTTTTTTLNNFSSSSHLHIAKRPRVCEWICISSHHSLTHSFVFISDTIRSLASLPSPFSHVNYSETVKSKKNSIQINSHHFNHFILFQIKSNQINSNLTKHSKVDICWKDWLSQFFWGSLQHDNKIWRVSKNDSTIRSNSLQTSKQIGK
jgi:hypothetical protein